MGHAGDTCEQSRWGRWDLFQELGGEKDKHRTVAGEGEGTEDQLLKNRKSWNSVITCCAGQWLTDWVSDVLIRRGKCHCVVMGVEETYCGHCVI